MRCPRCGSPNGEPITNWDRQLVAVLCSTCGKETRLAEAPGDGLAHTLRDYFASACLTGLLADSSTRARLMIAYYIQGSNPEDYARAVAHVAYIFADAMIAQRCEVGPSRSQYPKHVPSAPEGKGEG